MSAGTSVMRHECRKQRLGKPLAPKLRVPDRQVVVRDDQVAFIVTQEAAIDSADLHVSDQDATAEEDLPVVFCNL
jgi:hypothetical protein